MRLVVWSLMSVFAIVCMVFAIDSTTVPVDTIIKNVSDVVATVKGFNLGNVSIIVLFAAIIKLLISLMKFKPVAKYLDTVKMKAAKPYIAMAIGILGGIANNLISGQDILTGVITGLVAGLGSVGIHESIKTLQGKNK